MEYNFTQILERKGQDALALDVEDYLRGKGPNGQNVSVRESFSPIPMWVADMNFATVPTVQEAIIRRTQHPAFGYFHTRNAYYDAIIRWQEQRNGVTGLTAECIGYENGVLGGLVSAVNVLCSKGDKILVHSPTYIGFTNSLINNGYHMIHSPLQRDEAGVWRMDFADMEEKLRTQKIHTAIFCSPHNPCGRVWERWELERAMALYEKYNVYVISDEIWSDLTLPGHQHIPTQSVSEDARMRTVALYAPSKTFNLAGLVGSYHIIYNPWLRDRVRKESSLCHYNDQNVLSMHALMGAYQPEGYAWLDQLRAVLMDHVEYACAFIRAHFQGIEVAKPQGTYMLFLDCTQWCEEHHKSLDELLVAGFEVGVLWQDGRPFHGPCAIRLNLALPRALLEEAFERLDRYVFHPEG